MKQMLRKDADQIIAASFKAVLPDEAVCRALRSFCPGAGKTLLIAAGKAAWQMANAAVKTLGHVDGGVVVTKYNHVKGEIPGVICCEAGHPVPDENSFAATQKAIELVQGLITSFFSFPAAAVLYLKNRLFPVKNCRTLPVSCWPVEQTSWK